MERSCVRCGAKFEVRYQSSKRLNCSAKCRGVKNKRRTDAGSRRVEWISKDCPCGKSFEIPPWLEHQKSPRHCSVVCGRRYGTPGGRPVEHGHKSVQTDGYVWVYLDRAARPAGWTSSRYPEHRLVMMRMLGRDLAPGENVHHVNGTRGDNRPENLELWVTSQPSGQRVEDVVAWAREIIQRYEGDAMPNDYVEDYEALTGNKPAQADEPAAASAKVVEAPAAPEPKKSARKVTTK